jgi:hypothetical protein
MGAKKISISITDELDDALESIALSQGDSKSRIIENYLREHKVVQHYIDIVRSEPETGVLAFSKRSIDELRHKKPITA